MLWQWSVYIQHGVHLQGDVIVGLNTLLESGCSSGAKGEGLDQRLPISGPAAQVPDAQVRQYSRVVADPSDPRPYASHQSILLRHAARVS